jgi:hypothetical protein
LARLVNRFVPDPNSALVAISIAASCGAAWVIYLLTEAWHGREPARISLLLFLVSPLCWFHGIVALTYILEGFFSALIGYLCWRVYTGERVLAIPASVAFAVAAGFRPSGALLLAPLWLLSIWRIRGLRRWLAILSAVAATMCWFLVMADAAGGLRKYIAALTHLWLTVPGSRTVLVSPWLAVARMVTIGWIFVLCFGFASVFVFRPDASAKRADQRYKVFSWAWITPGFLFFAFVFLNFVNSGYLLVLCPPGFAFLAARVHEFVRARERRRLRLTAVAAGIAANCAVFAWAPLYCSYRSVRELERNMAGIAQDFRTTADPAKTLIVGFDSHFLGYRHAGYYLPDYVTVQYPEVRYPDGRYVFVMHKGDTKIVKSFPINRFERFVFFPLPEGDAYAAYISRLSAKLPSGTLKTAIFGDRKVITGPACAIPILFPTTVESGHCIDSQTIASR